MTIWKQIKEFPSYEVNNLGEVRGERGLLSLVGNQQYQIENTLLTPTKLIREYFPLDWTRHLEPGEEYKRVSWTKEPYLFFVSSFGRVWSSFYQRFLKPYPSKEYYHRYNISGRRTYRHNLVGRHFLPDYEEGLLILHKEETLPLWEIDKVSNLWVGTHKDNTRDMIGKGRHSWR